MSVLDIFSRFFMTVDYVAGQLLQNESPYMIALVITYCDVYGSSQGRVRRSQFIVTPTRRVSWYPRRVIKGTVFLGDYSLVVTCMVPR
jgi:hypothetical protein